MSSFPSRPRRRWLVVVLPIIVVAIIAGSVATAVVISARQISTKVVIPVRTMINQEVPRPTEPPAPTATTVVEAVTEVPTVAPTPTSTPLPTLTGTERVNVLLLGSDTDAKFGDTINTQIIIVVSIDPVHHRVTLFSVPRDFWVPIPGQGVQKIQLAYRYGGVALIRETVQNDFGIHIDHYAWIGLEGFVKVIDVAGGVNIDVTHTILDNEYPDDVGTANPFAYRRVFLAPGPQHLGGMEALTYVRSRHGDLIGDFGRSQRQQQVLLKLRQRLEQPGTILRIPAYVDALNGYVRSDFSARDLLAFSTFSQSVPRSQIDEVVLQAPTYADLGYSRDGQSIVIPKWSVVRSKVREVFRAPNQPPTPEPSPIPTGASIVVENATSTLGLGSRAVTYLQGLGYTVLPARDASGAAQPRSTIVVRRSDLLPEVEPLALLFHADTEVQSQMSLSSGDIVITLGKSHGTFEGLS